MTPRGLLLVLVVPLLGCSTDTGLIVAVSGQVVEELEFELATSRDDQFVLDPASSGGRYSVVGRDLGSKPFEMLLREDPTTATDLPPTVRVLVLGYAGGKVVAFALMEPPQLMVRGELLRRTLALQPVGDAARAGPAGKGCYSVSVGDKYYLLVSVEDRDCDGYGPQDSPPDCNDSDPSVHPGAEEICDGKDNNCDGQYEGPTELCYSRDTGGNCREGTRTCTDQPGSGLGPVCTVSDTGPAGRGSQGLQCLAYEGCFDDPAPLQCVATQLLDVSYACTLEVFNGTTCGGTRDLPPPFKAKEGCSWTLVDPGGLPISSMQPADTSCVSRLVVAADGASASGTLELEYQDPANKRGAFVSVQVTPKPVKACSSEPLSCAEN